MNGYGGGDDGSFVAGPYFQIAFDLPHALAHATQTNAERSHPILSGAFHIAGAHTFALIRNFEGKSFVVQRETNGGCGTAGMTMDVGQWSIVYGQKIMCEFSAIYFKNNLFLP